MTAYAGFLRALNVGGTGRLPMAELRALCGEIGFTRVRTYIASGNVVFDSNSDEAGVKASLQTQLASRYGRPIGVVIRSGPDLETVIAANPFPAAPAERTLVTLLDGPPPANVLETARGHGREEIAVIGRNMFIRYVDGIADSKLRLPGAVNGTARNLNTLRKLAQMVASERSGREGSDGL